MPTAGRGDYHAATFLWRWRPTALYARQVAHRLPVGFTPRWIAVVPGEEEAPDVLPASALVFALDGGDRCYVW